MRSDGVVLLVSFDFDEFNDVSAWGCYDCHAEVFFWELVAAVDGHAGCGGCVFEFACFWVE